MELTGKILSIISKNANCGKTVQPSDRIVEDLGLDSLDRLMIVQDLEDEFNISIETEEIKQIKVVQDIIDSVGRKIALAHT